jgi:DNA-binding NtrC family response regulator
VRCHVVDDRAEFFRVVAQKLGDGFHLSTFKRRDWQPADISNCDVIIVSVPPSGNTCYDDHIDELRSAVVNAGLAPVIGFVPEPDTTAMRDVIANGAYDCFIESSPLEELRIVLRRAAQYHELRGELDHLRSTSARSAECLVNADPKMMAIYSFAERIAPSSANVLVTGETGTGKEVLARAIHKASGRERFPFVPVACSSLPETLIEAELFGHERGAFTGATNLRLGRFEAAEQGTVFLDEIGELTPALQVKLLRVLQECKFERLGSNKARPMEARVICATNRALKSMVRSGQFRADLFYRLNTVEIHLPPLRERRDDIVSLAYLFLQRYAEKQKRNATLLGPVALAALRTYDWPGNVRELEHVIERAVVICEGPDVRAEHLPTEIRGDNRSSEAELTSLEFRVRMFKRDIIRRTLEQSGQNKMQAARNLRISRSSLHRLIDELELPAQARGTA